jgi:cell division protein ZipA
MRNRYRPPTGLDIQEDLRDDDFEIIMRPKQTQMREAVEPILSDPHSQTYVEAPPQHDPWERKATLSQEQTVINTRQQDQTRPSELVVLYVLAKDNDRFVGYELLQALLAAGLRYGEMSIFHRYEKPTGEGKTLFSLAQATEPGIFDMNAMGACSSSGLCLFMRLSSHTNNNLGTFNLLLDTAKQLAEDLNGIVTDKSREPLNAVNTQKLTQLALSFDTE